VTDGFVGVRVEGINELRRGLSAIDHELPRELGGDMERVASRTVLPRARALTPHRSGDLARSLTAVRFRSGVAVRSRLPYAAVQHWGGTTGKGHRPGSPGSGSVRIKGTRFVEKAAVERMEQFAVQLGEELDRFLGRHGLR
jgi:hypothetical protein